MLIQYLHGLLQWVSLIDVLVAGLFRLRPELQLPQLQFFEA